MSQSAAIQIDRLSHCYGDRTAVEDLTLEISAGEIFTLLGPNGSGKTTLFRVLSTLIPLQSGSVNHPWFRLSASYGGDSQARRSRVSGTESR